MSHRLKRILEEAECRELIAAVDAFIDDEYTRENVIARRAYGFHSPEPLIAMLLLTCGGIQLDPPLAQLAAS